MKDSYAQVPEPQQVEEFRALVKQKFGIELDNDEAQDLAQRTLTLVYMLKSYGLLRVK